MLRSNTLSYQNTQTAIVATGDSGSFNLPFNDYRDLTVGVVVTAASGTTPTLDLYLQVQAPDGNFYDVYHFPQQTTTTAAGSQVFVTVQTGGQRLIGAVGSKTVAANTLGVPLLDNTMKLAWTVTGTTPSFTFTTNFYSPDEDHGSL